MPDRVICDMCGQRVPPHAHYVVRIDVFADPTFPAIHSDDLEETDFDKTFADLLQEMQHLSADDLQDQVHRRFEYRLCRPCHRRYLANPLPTPRSPRPGKN